MTERAQLLERLAQFVSEQRRPHALDPERQAADQLRMPAALVGDVVLEALRHAKRLRGVNYFCRAADLIVAAHEPIGLWAIYEPEAAA